MTLEARSILHIIQQALYAGVGAVALLATRVLMKACLGTLHRMCDGFKVRPGKAGLQPRWLSCKSLTLCMYKISFRSQLCSTTLAVHRKHCAARHCLEWLYVIVRHMRVSYSQQCLCLGLNLLSFSKCLYLQCLKGLRSSWSFSYLDAIYRCFQQQTGCYNYPHPPPLSAPAPSSALLTEQLRWTQHCQ